MRRRYLRNRARGNIVYPGLIAAWSAKGKSNDDEDRAILKDLTGNGHDITLNGFAYRDMSGYGGYLINFTKVFTTYGNNKNAIIMHKIGKVYAHLGIFYGNIYTEIPSIKIKVTGISNTNANLRYKYVENETDNKASYYDMNEDGVYTLPKSVIAPNNFNSDWKGFTISQTVENIDLTIELLPEYPDALVFDGVDDYGINENMPILTDYTVIVKRIIMKNARGAVISKSYTVNQGSFIFEFTTGGQTHSFGNINYISIYDKNISWQNMDSYNQKQILVGEGIDGNDIYIGKIRKSHPEKLNMAFYSAYLFDRSLDEQEIKFFIRKYIDTEYVLPSEQTTT